MPSIEVKNSRVTSVVVGIVQHPVTKKILITKRTKDQHLAGFWEFPGGKLEPNEDLFHALQRELHEEVGIKIQSAYPFKKITYEYPDKTIGLNFWFITHFNEQAKAQEGQSLEWVELSDLKNYQFPAANQPILKSLLLPKLWMITPDCDLKTIETYLQSIKNSLIQFKIKQILFRSKNLKDDDYFVIYEKLKRMCFEFDCRVIINRTELNVDVSDSWHLTSTQLHRYSQRPIKAGLLSASCHTLSDIKQAEAIGVDFILLSAVSKTASHPDAITLGWYKFKQLAQQTTLPIYALGGVTRDDLSVAQYHGALGIAGISTYQSTL